MGNHGAAINLLSPHSPPSSPLSVDVTSVSSSVLTSPCAPSPAEKPSIVSKSSLDSDYPLNKVPMGFSAVTGYHKS